MWTVKLWHPVWRVVHFEEIEAASAAAASTAALAVVAAASGDNRWTVDSVTASSSYANLPAWEDPSSVPEPA